MIALEGDSGSGCSYLPHALLFPVLLSRSRFLRLTFTVMTYTRPETRDPPQSNDCERTDEDTTKNLNLNLKRVELEAPAETSTDPATTGQQPTNVDVILTNTSNPKEPAKCDAMPEDEKGKKSQSSGDSSSSGETRRLAMKKMSRIRFIWPTSFLTLKRMTMNTRIKLGPDMPVTVNDEMQELLSNFTKHVRPVYQG